MARVVITVSLGTKNSDGSYSPISKHIDPAASATGDVFLSYDNSVITTHSQLSQALVSLIKAAGGNTALTK